MTGEMCDPVNPEEWPLHAAIAEHFDGELRAFDVYQGPYILAPRPDGGQFKFWLNSQNGFELSVYEEMSDSLSSPFLLVGDLASRQEDAVAAAMSVVSAQQDQG